MAQHERMRDEEPYLETCEAGGGAVMARALYLACSSVGRTISTERDLSATFGPTGTSKLTPECCSSSVFFSGTLEKQESTDAALSRFRSGTCRNQTLLIQLIENHDDE